MDGKGRQSSAGKFFGRRLHKDKEKQAGEAKHSTTSSIDSPPGSAYGSQSSRHSARHSIGGASIDQRPVSMTAEGIFARAGPISSIDSPRDDASNSGEPLPHHLNKGGGDFHQYPVFTAPTMPPQGYQSHQSTQGPPRPPPHSNGTTIASSNPGDRGVSMQQWGQRGSSRDGSYSYYAPTDSSNNTRASSDQASLIQRPPDHIVEKEFMNLMVKRGWKSLPEQARRQMEAYKIDKKWTLVYQDKLAEFKHEEKKRQTQRLTYGGGGNGTQDILIRAEEEGSPEWYVKKVMDNSITIKQMSSLEISLRTQPIAWVRGFIEAQGQIALTNVLAKINRRKGTGPAPPPSVMAQRAENDVEREYEIIKCLKALMNNKYGADNALNYPSIIQALCGSLISSRLNTRKLVSDVLTFLCHWGNGSGHEKVLQSLDNLKSQYGESSRFDAWMRVVEVTVDGRGKMGSMVGASDEVRSGGIGVENLLMEYAIATLFLINMVVDAPERDLQLRMHVRAQFTACGIKRIFNKMEGFQYDVIDKQIEHYLDNEAVDYELFLEKENSSMVDSVEGETKDLNDPTQIAEAIMSKIKDTRAQDYFTSAMQHLLLMRDTESEDRLRMFQLVDQMLSYVAMDRRLPDMDLKQSLNFTVQSLLDKLYTDSEARQVRDEAVEARQIADSAIAERDEMKAQLALGADGLVSKLQKQLEEQERIIELRGRQVEQMKSELSEMQRIRAQELQRNELETRELYLMLRDAQDVAASAAKKSGKDGLATTDPAQMQGIMDRERLMNRLEIQLQRARTQATLEGRTLQMQPSEKLRELREKMEGEPGMNEQSYGGLEPSSFGSVRAKSGVPRRKPLPGLPGEIGEDMEMSELDDDDVVIEKPRLVQMHKPKLSSSAANALMADLASNVKRYDDSDAEGEGVTTGPSQPSLNSDSPKTPGSTDAPKANIPPPPPPPPGALAPGFGAAQQFALSGPRPKKKLKALHWDKVDQPTTTVWATRGLTSEEKEEKYQELARKGVLEEVEKLFLAKEIKAIGKKSGKKDDKKQIISRDLMHNFQISMAKFSSYAVEDVVRMIIHCDPKILDDPVTMEFLQKNDFCDIPDNTAKLMAPYSKDWTGPNASESKREQDPNELTREDQIYLFTAYELHHYWKSRMRALALTRTFQTDYDEISAKLLEISRVSESLRDSTSLISVLGLILDIGNFMNDANKQASGFKLSTLGRLGMLKDDRNESTFADVVERIVRNQYSGWEGFTDEISGVITAQKINVEQLQTDAKKYIDNIKNVQMSLDSGNLSDPTKFHPEDKVSIVVQRNMKEARRKAEQLQVFLEDMQKSYDDIMAFYGEDPSDDSSRRDFFAKLANFVQEWKKSKEKNTALEEQHRRNEISMRRKQAQNTNPLSPNALSDSDAPKSPASTGAMDDLLQKLRAAKPEARDQRDRRRRARLKDKHQVRVASGQKMPEIGVNMGDGSGAEGAADGEDEQRNKLLSPMSETADSEAKGLQSGASLNKDGSLSVRRRRESADTERQRRRNRRNQASSVKGDETAGPMSPAIPEEGGGDAGEGDSTMEGASMLDDTAADEVGRDRVASGEPQTPVTVVHPPSPEAKARDLPTPPPE
ncbi:cytokinesis protein sepa [Pyrenophora tritici-repentis]|uniref:Cytokinesis protein sepA n=1 Tax=Pyrenophora tritici-repentis TaxID=45151 RepID=A0A834RZ00_9PLEO|nr:cytokinesis protein sepa [Pyrenophora tritici-repentis]KAF7572431.1 cytokinesis protein sepA [Pyrenophora tritici-repentis]KAI0575944.1 cytokinesis protein sepa [Pyrenophora tritici-repentis]KAI0606730.1 cytokinesis protein sepa [Pyrenophora tritici-repentis]KAI0617423.1 cytokinesis protein sepa [Pyrenophora tritici-repentis]